MPKTYALSDREIIQLYENGMSQSDINRKYNISLKHTRAVLKKAGFNTSGYRRIPAEHEEVIGALLLAGIPYRSVGEVTDMSFHVIRDIAERLPDRPDRRPYRKLNYRKMARDEAFLSRYLDGECFCSLCVSMDLSDREIVRCYSMLNDPVSLSRHSDALRRRLNAEDKAHNTETSLARKYGISASVVKAHLNS